MFHEAVVKKVIGSGGWVVLTKGNNGESENCGSQCNSCHSDCKNNDLVFVDDISFAQIGDTVELLIENTKIIIAVVVSLLFPVFMLVFGIILGNGDITKQAIYGGVLFLVAVVCAYSFDKKFKAKIKVIRIVEKI
ncbi:MAG: SoxR reducing system RseC family protein [Caldisericia bacterium]|nr:SoxR reducing system RseC family protein [Caldisericia bacterium]